MGKGQYTITLDHERRLVYSKAEGEIDKALGQELITKGREKAAEYQYNILCNVQNSRATVNLVDWFFLPRTLKVYRDDQTRFFKAAIVANKGKQENAYRFFENVAFNVGLRIKIFVCEKDALEWLENKSSLPA